MGTAHLYESIDHEAVLACLIDVAVVNAQSIFDPAALTQWRIACLLSWYCFHQYPGKAQELRIATLIRKAYHYGLHQIDSADNLMSFGWDLASPEDLEDWRRVWWCIYMLDSFASFSTAAPHMVETDSVQTALLRGSSQFDDAWSKKFFLSFSRANLWEVVRDIASTSVEQRFNLYMAINTLLKEAVALHRLEKQNGCQTVGSRMSELKDYLCAIQLALPPNYMRPTQDLMGNESRAGYSVRLQTMLKIYSTRLLLCLPSRGSDEAQWKACWDENFEICYHTVEVIKQWDTQVIPAINPTVCLIALPVLMFLHLHSQSRGSSNPSLLAELNRRRDIVRLLLRQYASHWALPRFLLGTLIKPLATLSSRLTNDCQLPTTHSCSRCLDLFFQKTFARSWINSMVLCIRSGLVSYL